MMDRAETQKMPKRLEGDFDYIVVGAGTAGCIVANRLSADPRKRVLILEAGGSDNWIWFHIPVGYLFAIGNPSSDWMFRTEPEAGLNGRSLAYPRGKVIGGSSIISWARASTTAPEAAGASRRRVCPGPTSTRSAMPRRKWEFAKFRISTPATMRASAISM